MKKQLITLLLSYLPLTFIFAQTISTVTPGSAFQGQTIQVSISGQNTYFVQGTTTSWLTRGNDAILPTINSVQSYTSVNSIYQIPSNAALGYWDLHVIDPIFGELLKLDAILIDEFVGVDPRGGAVKKSIQLGPNPATDHFTLKYNLPTKALVQIQIRDLKGALIHPVFVGNQTVGSHEFTVQLADLSLPSGVFLVSLQVDEMIFAIKTTVLK
jgi:hypothetical protein